MRSPPVLASLLRVIAVGLVLALVPGPAVGLHGLFAPKAKLWQRWSAHDQAATAHIDHGAWQRFLDRHIARDGEGLHRVAYGRVGAADKRALEDYLARLATTPISIFNRDQQLAYWINLYNALTVKIVLDHYPLRSIRDIDISPGIFADGPWGKKAVKVEGEELSLNDIEHRILRPIWRDPRIHYAVNCAAVGCPNLVATAFTGDNANALLTAAARDYVNSPRGARFEGGKLIVSSLYVWYEKDFGGNESGVIAHLERYAAPDLAARLATVERISGDGYDWALNDALRPSPRIN